MLLSSLSFNELDFVTNLTVNLRVYCIIIKFLNIVYFYRNAVPQDQSLQKKFFWQFVVNKHENVSVILQIEVEKDYN